MSDLIRQRRVCTDRCIEQTPWLLRFMCCTFCFIGHCSAILIFPCTATFLPYGISGARTLPYDGRPHDLACFTPSVHPESFHLTSISRGSFRLKSLVNAQKILEGVTINTYAQCYCKVHHCQYSCCSSLSTPTCIAANTAISNLTMWKHLR